VVPVLAETTCSVRRAASRKRRTLRLSQAFVLLVLVAPHRVAAQTPPERLTIARRHIAARQFDSARVVLRAAVDSTAGGSVAQRAEGFVLLAIVEEHTGQDSVARAALLEAVRIKPNLEVEGLDQIAPRLADILAEERCRAAGVVTAEGMCRPKATAVPDTAVAPFQDCTRRCPEGVSKPILRELPDIGRQLPPGRMGPSGVRGQVTLEFVVSPEGFVDPGSARVSVSTIQAYEPFLLNRLTTARFAPALARDGPVPARIRMRFDFRASGLDRVSYTVRVL
jgi:hypothetical protein